MRISLGDGEVVPLPETDHNANCHPCFQRPDKTLIPAARLCLKVVLVGFLDALQSCCSIHMGPQNTREGQIEKQSSLQRLPEALRRGSIEPGHSPFVV